MISKKAAEEQKVWTYWEGFEDALSLLEIPECPFCGAKAQVYICDCHWYIVYTVGCTKCNVQVPLQKTRELAISAWNRREK